jgi:O-antigen/teichoic acid export membrane protein
VLLFNREIIVVLLGEKWLPSAAALVCLIPVMVFRLLSKFPGAILTARGVLRPLFLSQIVYATCLIVFGLSFLRFGIPGVASATSLSVSVVFGMLTLLVARDLEIRFRHFLPLLLRSAFIFALMVLAGFAIKSVLDKNGLSAFITICVATPLYAALSVVVLWHVRNEILPTGIDRSLLGKRAHRVH